jgi:hypothetical protein
MTTRLFPIIVSILFYFLVRLEPDFVNLLTIGQDFLDKLSTV